MDICQALSCIQSSQYSQQPNEGGTIIPTEEDTRAETVRGNLPKVKANTSRTVESRFKFIPLLTMKSCSHGWEKKRKKEM